MAVDVDFLQSDRLVEREVFRETVRDAASDEPACPHVVKDASGNRWRVTEVSGRFVPGARGEACLVFESDSAIRRVWHYPPAWRDLPEPELLRVSWGR
jgi:hypothetical protein